MTNPVSLRMGRPSAGSSHADEHEQRRHHHAGCAPRLRARRIHPSDLPRDQRLRTEERARICCQRRDPLREGCVMGHIGHERHGRSLKGGACSGLFGELALCPTPSQLRRRREAQSWRGHAVPGWRLRSRTRRHPPRCRSGGATPGGQSDASACGPEAIGSSGAPGAPFCATPVTKCIAVRPATA
jgi:hypothetical protein